MLGWFVPNMGHTAARHGGRELRDELFAQADTPPRAWRGGGRRASGRRAVFGEVSSGSHRKYWSILGRKTAPNRVRRGGLFLGISRHLGLVRGTLVTGRNFQRAFPVGPTCFIFLAGGGFAITGTSFEIHQ